MSLPHVTAILRDAGLIDVSWFTDEAREIGSAVHKATELLDQNDLDWDSVDISIVQRIAQYQRFLNEVRPEILAIEAPVRNETLQYQGRFDRLVRINGREGILDIKGPSRAAWQGVQLAMYAGCLHRPLARWTLHLSDDRYQLIEHKDRMDWQVAKACLTIAAWKGRNGTGH